MKAIFNKTLVILFLIINYIPSIAQENSADTVVKVSTPVKHTFENAVLMNNQTVEKGNKKTLDFMIQHRFGIIENIDDMFGIFGPSNIRLGLNYAITNRLAVGIGASKNKHLYDLEWKYLLLKQMKNGGSPVTISYYGNMGRSADDKDKFINQDSAYKSSNRNSYFNEIMIARKINNALSLQIAATYSHYNIVDSVLGKHDFYGGSFIGRYKFSPQSSVHIEFDYLFNVSDIEKESRPLPNLGIGYEVATSGHQFQMFICTANGIIGQETRVYNLNDFTKKEVLIGFNITRQWGF
ncbi:MAG: DUF5777 family beta-barrel protein [Bacteroidia bacterium]